ncbi:MAG: preprotein translocase subunit SecY [Anaerolineae bacterium]|nr:preprotein translocase subunit SecY [Anaerolineae bacterium]
MSEFFGGLREVFRLPDLRRRILITLVILVIYRLAANIPVPGVDHDLLAEVLSPESDFSGAIGIFDLLSGGAVSNFSVLAMGPYPYVTASIILTILTPLVPALEELSKEGQAGRDKINFYTALLTVPMAAFNAITQINFLRNPRTGGLIISGFGFAADDNILLTVTVLAVMTAGTMFAIWLGELITRDGIGNGLSLIIFAGIVARVPSSLQNLYSAESADMIRNIILFVVLTVVTIFVVVVVQEGQRRIPVKYGKRVRGMKMYGGGTTHLPLRVNTAGMIPLIFAQVFLTFPTLVAKFVGQSQVVWLANVGTSVSNFFGQQGGTTSTEIGGQIAYWAIYFVLVVAFTYIYTEVMIRNQNLAENLQRNGGFILGIRPGKNTEDFINKVVQRITLVGALFLGGIAVLPGVVQIVVNLIQPTSGVDVRNALLIISGGGMIIIVGVVIDTMRQLEAQLVMRNRESFIR